MTFKKFDVIKASKGVSVLGNSISKHFFVYLGTSGSDIVGLTISSQTDKLDNPKYQNIPLHMSDYPFLDKESMLKCDEQIKIQESDLIVNNDGNYVWGNLKPLEQIRVGFEIKKAKNKRT